MNRALLYKAVLLLVAGAATLIAIPNARSHSAWLGAASSSSSSVLAMAQPAPSKMPSSGRSSPQLVGAEPVVWGAGGRDTDASTRPGDDFYRYANGGWLATVTVPAGRQSYDTRAMLAESTRQRVRDLVQGAATAHAAGGSVTQKVGDFYASYMDVGRIEDKGVLPLSGEMARIAAIANRKALSAYLGTTLNREVDGLTANSDHVIGLWVNQGFEDADHNLPHLWQGGLGLPDRDSYLDAAPAAVELRAKYQAHIAAVLKLAGFDDAAGRAGHVVALETAIARAFAPDSDAADVFKQNNPWKRRDFEAKAPGMDWEAYFTSAGLEQQADFLVWQPSAVSGVSALVGKVGVEEWKDYLRFHLIEHYAGVLPATVRDEHFAFYGTVVSGAKQAPERGEAALDATNGALSQAVGQLYAQQYFPPEAKAKAEDMVRNLIAAYRARMANLEWMSPETKQKALAKLAALEVEVGYPDQWTDYSSLKIVRGDAFGNMRRAEEFYHERDLDKLKQPVEPIEWPLNVQAPGAVIMFSPNTEFFSAGILQPPYFDPQGDAAANYGSAGAAMAHEITHSFDELGNIYDARGRLGKWWTDEDQAKFREQAARLVAQYDAYCPLPEVCVKGKQVESESVADLAGLLVAHDAYVLSLKGKTDAVIDGMSGEQRFFVAFAQRWRRIQTEPALRKQIATDSHPPGEYRSDAVRNVDAWYPAFSVAAGDRLYVKPEDRPRIW
jgi:predicted metalloendopeptidase